MARQLIDAMTGPWRPSDYRDTYADRVNELIEAKKHNKELQPADEAPAATNVVDLADVLQASVPPGRHRGIQRPSLRVDSPVCGRAARRT
jgi:DNA end-binding protein Ku